MRVFFIFSPIVIPAIIGLITGMIAARIFLAGGLTALVIMALSSILMIGHLFNSLEKGRRFPDSREIWAVAAATTAVLHVSIWVVNNPAEARKRFPGMPRSVFFIGLAIANALVIIGPPAWMSAVFVAPPRDSVAAFKTLAKHWLGLLFVLATVDSLWQGMTSGGDPSSNAEELR